MNNLKTKWDSELSMTLTHREIELFKVSLEFFLKKNIRKCAREERNVLGAGAFTELEEYIEHVQGLIDASLSKETFTTG